MGGGDRAGGDLRPVASGDPGAGAGLAVLLLVGVAALVAVALIVALAIGVLAFLAWAVGR